MVDFDKLREIQQEENRKKELLQLNKNFYKNTGKYLKDLQDEIQRQDGKAELILRDEYDSAIKVIENIFHRRIGKIISLSTRHIQNEKTDTKKMLPIEKQIYNKLCNDLQTTKNKVMTQIKPTKPTKKQPKQTENLESDLENEEEKNENRENKTDMDSEEPSKTFNNSQHPYTVVRIIDNFPRFVSSDHRTHQLSKEDIVYIPNNDAKVLVERKIAKKIETR
ncbi:DNA replication initiation complex subunit GINS15 family [Methanonatronarchaeum thermophilum]|uniref:DNA replication initiation complex subunit GINS15 family n=1 Tax=Methanonatronarchaeum thermophilum TaxID=1927129 RepID=A0A1Y3GH92_9EURY|nr:hypothetical protein [Methanonatronarchaeum thermophilum]OUJ18746.1 DNA replication initiation complex subunit GINS15 family [Methanonatronarchaeum thermophilum]